MLMCGLQSKVQQIMAMLPADLGKSQQQLMVNQAENQRSHRSRTCQAMAASPTTRCRTPSALGPRALESSVKTLSLTPTTLYILW